MTTITGSNGSNILVGTNAGDVINANGGNDIVLGGNGNDTIDGGSGNDVLSGGNGNDAIVGGSGNDLISGDDGNDSLDGGAGSDILLGGAGNDTLTYNVAENVAAYDIYGGGQGQDTLRLVVSQAFHNSAAFQADLAQLQARLASGSATYAFQSIDLLVTSIEQLQIVIVGGGNQAPTAVNDTVNAVEDTTRTITAASLLANDTDPNAGDGKTIVSVGNAVSGTVTLNAAGDVVFVPAPNFSGAASFTYTMQDSAGATSTATVTVVVAAVNDAPTTAPVTLTAIAEDSGARIITQADLLANASDIDGPALSAVNLQIASGSGSLVDNLNGTWTYTPAANDATAVSFSYTVTDGTASVAATASLDITPVNDAPTTAPVTLTAIAEDSGARIITQADLLANASDIDGPGLSAVNLQIASGSGGLVDNLNGTWTYTPAANDATAVSFSYAVTDGTTSVAATASLDITPVNDAPTSISLSAADPDETTGFATVNENTPGAFVGTLSGTDPDTGDALSFSIADPDSPFEVVVGNVLKLKDGVALDFEGESEVLVTVTVTDSSGATFDRGFTVAVNDGFESLAIDGYISGATVFADANGDGVFTAGEATTTTDAFGNFTLFGGSGQLIMSGGVDISTNQAFEGVMRAPEGSTVVTPLTTLVVAIVEATGANVADATDSVLAGLGLPPGIDLSTFDPIAAAMSSDPTLQQQGGAAIAAAVQIQNTIVQAASLLEGAGASFEDAAASVLAELAAAIDAQTLDLNDGTAIQAIIEDAASNTAGVNQAAVEDAAAGAANVISASNTVVEAASGQTGTDLLTTLAQVAIVAGDAAAALTDVGAGTATIASVEGDFTGSNLADAVEAAEDEVGDVVGVNGDDTIIGTEGPDTLEGFGGNDTLIGLGGHDLLDGGDGNDTLNGGAGRDRATYVDATGSITVNLAAGTVSGAGVGTDTLREVEMVRGSDFVDTYVATGFGAAGALNVGSDGNFNQFEGRGGNDVITGNGNTSVSYRNATGAVNVDLREGFAVGDASVGEDELISVSGVNGSAYNDMLRGDDFSNNLTGGAGNDFLGGRGGNDRASYANIVDDIVTGGVTINLAAGTATGDASVGTDTLRSIEFIRGSNFADTYDSTGFGEGGLNIGNSGTFNEIEGMGGNDTIIANGNTRIAFYNATGAVTVDLAAGTATGNSSVGTDTITGGVIQVAGSRFGDTFYGRDTTGQTAENFEGRAGNDFIDGRGGFDRALYNMDGAVSAGITVNLAAGTVIGDAAVGTDTLRSVEGVRGTNFADTFDATGFSTSSTNAGSGSNFNEFEGLGGNDTITGNGNTRISYANATNTLLVNFSAGTVSGGSSVGIDTFTGVSSVQGSNFDDTFVYGSGAGSYAITNFVAGAGGVDEINLTGVAGMWDLDHVLAVATQQVTGTVLNFGNGDVLTLNNVTLGNLVASDFQFTPNQAPSVGLASWWLPENTPTLTPIKVADIVVSDDGFGTNNLSLAGPDAALFEIVGMELHLRAGVTLDYESLSSLQVTVQVDDAAVGVTPDATADFTLTVTDVNDVAPTIISGATASEAENTAVANVVYQATSTDPDTVGTVTYSLSGDDASLFDIDGDTGAVTFIASPNFETPADFDGNNVYDIVVHANDGIHDTTQNVAITVTDVNDVAPTFTSGTTASEAENTAIANVVYQATATDPDTVGTVTYSLSGDDASLFNIDGVTGAVTFIASPNFETPADFDGDNVYDIVVHANDGVHDTTTNVAITVTDVNDVAPTITSGATASEAENTAIANVVYQAAATDPDTVGTVSYSLSGDDASLFDIDGDTGAVTFIASPNFETPADFDGDNVYNVVVHANDGIHDTTQNVAISVTNVSGNFIGTTADDNLIGSSEEDTIQGLDGNDLLQGLRGNDTLDGGSGRDRVSYTGATGAIAVDLALGTVTGLGVGSDTLLSVEQVIGSAFADTFVATGFSDASANAGSNGTINLFEGRGGNDTITGNGTTQVSYRSATAAVTVNIGAGTASGDASVGSDTFTGVNAVRGSEFADSLTGGGGNDQFTGGAGNDTIVGGNGVDRAAYFSFIDDTTTGGVTINMAAGTVTGDASVGTDTLTSVETIRGSSFADSYTATGYSGGSNGNFNEFEGMGGNDTILGNGNTRIVFLNATSGVTVDLAAGTASGDASTGNDTISATVVGGFVGGINAVFGSQFADSLSGSLNANQTSELFDGRAGNDLIDGRGGFDTALYGNDAAVTEGIGVAASGGGLTWTVTGDTAIGTDTLTAVESIRGTNFADSFDATGFSGASTDASFNNGTNFNEFEGLGGSDTITGNGNTRLSFANATTGAGVTVDLVAGTATSVNASIGNDTFTGVSRVRGSNNNDTISGDSGGNALEGQGGNDTIDGREGNDTITGGAGGDFLTGGADNDTFRYTAVSDSAPATFDTITDFTVGQDLIDLAAIDSNTVAGGNNTFAFGGQNASVVANSITWFQDGSNNTIVQGDTNGDSAADITITLTGLKTLVASDFLL